MGRLIVAAVALVLGSGSAARAQLPAAVSGNAVAGLVSRTAKAEVHLLIDPKLSDGSIVIKLVVLNRTGAPVLFGPDAVAATAPDGTPVPLIPREALLARLGGAAAGPRETNNAHETPVLPTLNSAGQQDVTGFSGGMGMTTSGVPASALERSAAVASPGTRARYEAVLLKPMSIPAGGADGGQVFTQRLRRGKLSQVLVSVAFAGETHRFRVDVPR